MMYAFEYKNRNMAVGISALVHVLFLAYLFFSLIEMAKPVETEAGIMVAIGNPNENSLGDEPQGETLEPTPQESSEPAPAKTPSVSKDPVSVVKSAPPKDTKIISSTSEDTKVTAKKVEDTKPSTASSSSSKAGNNNNTQANTSSEDQAAKAKAEADAKKKKYGSLFGKGQGDAAGDGNKGDPNGDPNAKNLEGISKGKGTVGEGLSNRPVRQAPTIAENSQKYGKVVVKVCVDKSGKVTSAKFTQKGSTTTDAELVRTAERGAMKYVFAEGQLDTQCGSITFDFKLH
jgi:TonB family protein